VATYARDLLGDLIVATTELVEAGAPPDERWLWLAITTCLAARPGEELLAPLRAQLFTPAFLAAVHERPLRTIAVPWPERCLHRSVLELLRDLYPGHAHAIDTSALELAMIAAGPTGFASVVAPEGIPVHHWWWWAGTPPGELRLNQRMTELLTLAAREVPPLLRALDVLRLADTVMSVEAYLPPDDSRRPVDLAACVLACARWLAAELRRASPQRYRIVATVRRETMTSRLWFGVDPAIDLESDEGVLVLDTQ
jgi:hypothetical protein